MGVLLILISSLLEGLIFSRFKILGVTPALTIFAMLWGVKFLPRRRLLLVSLFAALLLDALLSLSLLAFTLLLLATPILLLIDGYMPKDIRVYDFFPSVLILAALTASYFYIQNYQIANEIGASNMSHFLFLSVSTTISIWLMSRLFVRT